MMMLTMNPADAEAEQERKNHAQLLLWDKYNAAAVCTARFGAYSDHLDWASCALRQNARLAMTPAALLEEDMKLVGPCYCEVATGRYEPTSADLKRANADAQTAYTQHVTARHDDDRCITRTLADDNVPWLMDRPARAARAEHASMQFLPGAIAAARGFVPKFSRVYLRAYYGVDEENSPMCVVDLRCVLDALVSYELFYARVELWCEGGNQLCTGVESDRVARSDWKPACEELCQQAIRKAHAAAPSAREMSVSAAMLSKVRTDRMLQLGSFPSEIMPCGQLSRQRFQSALHKQQLDEWNKHRKLTVRYIVRQLPLEWRNAIAENTSSVADHRARGVPGEDLLALLVDAFAPPPPKQTANVARAIPASTFRARACFRTVVFHGFHRTINNECRELMREYSGLSEPAFAQGEGAECSWSGPRTCLYQGQSFLWSEGGFVPIKQNTMQPQLDDRGTTSSMRTPPVYPTSDATQPPAAAAYQRYPTSDAMQPPAAAAYPRYPTSDATQPRAAAAYPQYAASSAQTASHHDSARVPAGPYRPARQHAQVEHPFAGARRSLAQDAATSCRRHTDNNQRHKRNDGDDEDYKC